MFQLIYCSVAKPKIAADDILAILATSRSFNKANDITGCLLYHDEEFIQILEGERTKVKDLFRNILKDQRHHYVRLLVEENVKARVFESWNMAFHDLGPSGLTPIVKSLFTENVMAFSDFAEKPTDATELFWYVAKQILDGNWPAGL